MAFSLVRKLTVCVTKDRDYFARTEPLIFFLVVSPVCKTGNPVVDVAMWLRNYVSGYHYANFPTRRGACINPARTAATSPRTMAVTKPASIFSQPTSLTFADLTIASALQSLPPGPCIQPCRVLLP